jgi:hypothetical protein
MASLGSGIGRFSRKRVSTPNDAAAPATPAVVTNESEQTPTASNDVFPSFDSGVHGGADTFGNVDMFGGSFDMNFQSSSNEPSYDYDTSTFDDFVVAEEPENSALASESDTTLVPIGLKVSTVAETNPSQATTATQQGSTVTQAVHEKTNAGLFSSLRGNEPHASSAPVQNMMGAPVASTPLARPKTSVPHPSDSKSAPVAGLSMFARKRAASAPSQEVDIANASAGITILPPPRVRPSKPLPNQQDNRIVPTTPNGGIFLPGLSGGINNVATPYPRNGNNESDMGQQVLQRDVCQNHDTVHVTPEPADAAVTSPMDNGLLTSMINNSCTSPTSVYQDDADATSPETEESEDDFDGLLSQFLSDLRTDMDLLEKGDVELLDLEVALSEVFALTLSNHSEALDLLDGVEEANSEADRLIAEYTQML